MSDCAKCLELQAFTFEERSKEMQEETRKGLIFVRAGTSIASP